MEVKNPTRKKFLFDLAITHQAHCACPSGQPQRAYFSQRS